MRAMNTGACFVFLLAIGLSIQKAEFETDFEFLVNKMKLPNNTTLLNCPENCDEIKEPGCKCVDFSQHLSSSVYNFIKSGLKMFNISCVHQTPKRICNFFRRLELLNNNMEKEMWRTPKSPKVFLEYIKDNLQKLYASG